MVRAGRSGSERREARQARPGLLGHGDRQAFAAVKSGTFGKHLTLVSLAGATAGQSYLRVGVDKSRFKKAPSFDQDAELTAEDEISAYEYFGLDCRPPDAGARRLAKH